MLTPVTRKGPRSERSFQMGFGNLHFRQPTFKEHIEGMTRPEVIART
jgi:hypothetical protein